MVSAVKKLMLCIGIVCLFLAAVGMAGFLPLDLWQSIIDIFIDRPEGVFYKIVPSENAGIGVIVLSVVGLMLILLSQLNLNRSDSN